MPKPLRRALPPLFLSNEEYELLDEIAKDRETSIAEVVMELIAPLVDGSGKVVVLQLPDETYQAFAEFFEDEGQPEPAMTRFLEVQAKVLATCLDEARGQ